MNIIIDEKVKKYLDSMGRDSVTIYSEIIGSCWSPMPELFVKLREPEVSDDYNKFESDGVNIYIFKDAKLGDTLKLKMSEHVSDLPNKEIAVEGIDLS